MKRHLLALIFAVLCLGAVAQQNCTITQLPYRVAMNENYPDLLECWTISSNSRFLYDEDYVMTLNLSAMESGCVITPPIDPSIPMNSIVVKWRMQGDYYNSCDYMEVSVGTDPTNESSFTPVGSANCPNGNDHDRIFEVSLQNYNGPGRHIRLRPTGNLGRCYLYEVSLEHYNDCYSPLVTDSWSADTTAYNIVPDTAAGYVIQDVLVDEISQGPVPTYTFYAVDADHTIRAEFLNVGIDDLPDNLIAIYPNPTNGKLTVSGTGLQVSRIDIYDVYGKLLQTLAVNDVVADLDVSGLPAGLYFLRIQTDNGAVTKRFVKR